MDHNYQRHSFTNYTGKPYSFYNSQPYLHKPSLNNNNYNPGERSIIVSKPVYSNNIFLPINY